MLGVVDAEELLAALALEVGGHGAVILVTSLLCITISMKIYQWKASEFEPFVDELPELVEDIGEAAADEMYLLLDS